MQRDEEHQLALLLLEHSASSLLRMFALLRQIWLIPPIRPPAQHYRANDLLGVNRISVIPDGCEWMHAGACLPSRPDLTPSLQGLVCPFSIPFRTHWSFVPHTRQRGQVVL